MQKVASGLARENGVDRDRRFTIQHNPGHKIISAPIVRRVSAVDFCFFTDW